MVKTLTSGMSLTGNGLRDWLVQRFSAVIIAVYFCIVMIFFIFTKINYVNLKDFFHQPWMQILSLLLLLSLLLHAWVGIWTVITDYVKPIALRIFIQALVIIALIIYFFWGIEILWRLI